MFSMQRETKDVFTVAKISHIALYSRYGGIRKVFASDAVSGEWYVNFTVF